MGKDEESIGVPGENRNYPAILALDIATITGWAIKSDRGIVSGTWGLSPTPVDDCQYKGTKLWWRLEEMSNAHDITKVAYELPFIHAKHKRGMMSTVALTGILRLWADSHRIEEIGYTTVQIKKHATGKGNADKGMMVAAAKERWPDRRIADDNEADALWVLDLHLRGGKNDRS